MEKQNSMGTQDDENLIKGKSPNCSAGLSNSNERKNEEVDVKKDLVSNEQTNQTVEMTEKEEHAEEKEKEVEYNGEVEEEETEENDEFPVEFDYGDTGDEEDEEDEEEDEEDAEEDAYDEVINQREKQGSNTNVQICQERRKVEKYNKDEKNVEERKKKERKVEEGRKWIGLLKPIVSLFYPVFKNVGNIVSVFFGYVSAFVFSFSSTGNFTSWYEGKFGRHHTNFFKGSAKEAFLEACMSQKLLILYCHVEDVKNTYLCEYILKDPQVKDFIDSHFIFYADWASLIRKHVPFLRKEDLRVSTMFVIKPSGHVDNTVQLYARIYGEPTGSKVTKLLAGCISYMYSDGDTVHDRRDIMPQVYIERLGAHFTNEFEHVLNQKLNAPGVLGDNVLGRTSRRICNNEDERRTSVGVSEPKNTNTHIETSLPSTRNVNNQSTIQGNVQNDLILNRLIRQQQDLEYQEALKCDQIKQTRELQKQLMKTLKKKAKNAVILERKKRREKYKLDLKEGDQITKICYRFPNGKRVQQNFSVEHTLLDIYEWIECTEFNDTEIKVPIRFELICVHSKLLLERNDKKIKDCDLYPNAVLNVNSLDTTDEE